MEKKDVVGFEGLYAVTKDGRIWSHRRGIWMRPHVGRLGYHRVQLRGRKRFLVHRLVALAFLPLIPGKSYVNHKDGDKGHNHVLNLEWSTMSENVQHAFNTGLKRPVSANHYGEDNPKAVLTEKKVRKLVRESGMLTQAQLADRYGVSKSAVKHVLSGRNWAQVTGGRAEIPKKINRRILLSTEKVAEIRELYVSGVTQADLARQFNTSPSVIHKTVRGITWKDTP